MVGSALNWFTSYLSVSVCFEYGVPQGSVLELVLFKIYSNLISNLYTSYLDTVVQGFGLST